LEIGEILEMPILSKKLQNLLFLKLFVKLLNVEIVGEALK
jgi:hypothetical protein